MVLFCHGECRAESFHDGHSLTRIFLQVSNVILRFGWTIYLIPGPATRLTHVVVIAFLEMLRRFQWNFFRLETEHLGNADTYRITKDVPLPYTIPNRASEDEDEDGEKREKRNTGSHRLAMLRRRPTKEQDIGDGAGSDRDSSDEPSSPLTGFRKIGKKVEKFADAHLNDPSAREYVPQKQQDADLLSQSRSSDEEQKKKSV